MLGSLYFQGKVKFGVLCLPNLGQSTQGTGDWSQLLHVTPPRDSWLKTGVYQTDHSNYLSENIFFVSSSCLHPMTWGQGLMTLDVFIFLVVVHSFQQRRASCSFHSSISKMFCVLPKQNGSKSHSCSWKREMEHKPGSVFCTPLRNFCSLRLCPINVFCCFCVRWPYGVVVMWPFLGSEEKVIDLLP